MFCSAACGECGGNADAATSTVTVDLSAIEGGSAAASRTRAHLAALARNKENVAPASPQPAQARGIQDCCEDGAASPSRLRAAVTDGERRRAEQQRRELAVEDERREQERLSRAEAELQRQRAEQAEQRRAREEAERERQRAEEEGRRVRHEREARAISLRLEAEAEEERCRLEAEARSAREDTRRAERARKDEEELDRFLTAEGFAGPGDKRRRMFRTSYPLHVAVQKRNAKVVRLLFKAGADPSQRDSRGLTPAELAQRSQRVRHGRGTHDEVLDAFGLSR